MRLFFSHCWKDKPVAELLAHDIASGQHLALLTSRYVKHQQVDLALLVWSRYSANDTQMNNDIVTLRSHHTPIVVCCFDNVTLPDSLSGLPCCDFSVYSRGLAQVRQYIGQEDSSLQENYLPDSPPTQRTHLWSRYLSRRRTAHLSSGAESTPLLSTRAGYLSPPESLVNLFSSAEKLHSQITASLEQYIVPDELPQASSDIHYYVTSSIDILGLLYDITFDSPHAASQIIVQYLHTYLALRDSHHATHRDIFDCMDCPWLIHNCAYRLIESGLISAVLLPFEWQHIVRADDILVSILKCRKITEREGLLLDFMQLIAKQVTTYQPQFVHYTTDYHPYLGYAKALELDFALADITRTD
jgi:hypothetical protein